MDDFLLQGEHVLDHSTAPGLVLTTHRVRLVDPASAGARRAVSILLEKVNSCEIVHQNGRTRAIMGGALFLFGAFSLTQPDGFQQGAPSLLLALVFGVAYLTGRCHILTVQSEGGAFLSFETKKHSTADLLAFVSRLEQAKQERVRQLNPARQTPSP
jgi:hypothetical protein